MTGRYLELAFTPAVLREQQRAGGAGAAVTGFDQPDPLGPEEAAFLAARDAFYLASVNEAGWPYVQHRGGPPGFLHVLAARTLAFADLRGNRQLLTAGNVAADPRVSLFAMDYPGRRRLKLFGRLAFSPAAQEPELAARLAPRGARAPVERVARIAVEAWDWNCPQHITPRYTLAEVEELAAPLRARIAELEAELARRPGR